MKEVKRRNGYGIVFRRHHTILWERRTEWERPSAGRIRWRPANRAPGLEKAQQREEEVAENNHHHRQHVQREILHQDRMSRHHNAFGELLAS